MKKYIYNKIHDIYIEKINRKKIIKLKSYYTIH